MDSLISRSGIKSVQRGTGSLSITFKKNGKPAAGEVKLTAPLNPVDPEKCIVILNGLAVTDGLESNSESSSSPEFVNLPYVYNLTKNDLVIKDTMGSSVSGSNGEEADGYLTLTSRTKISWQVIEFY